MDEVETKTCSKCGNVCPTSEFPRRSQSKDGLRSWCRECWAAYMRAYGASHRDKMRRLSKESQDRHKEKVAIRKKKYALRYAIKQANGFHVNGICVICHAEGQMRLHHQDYSKPNEVDVLCPSCHGRVHSAVRELMRIAVK